MKDAHLGGVCSGVAVAALALLSAYSGPASADTPPSTHVVARLGDAPVRYVPPAPVYIRRFYVYGTTKQRRNQTVTVESLVKTSESDVVAGDQAVLERRLEHGPSGSTDWVRVANVAVTKVLPRSRFEVEIKSENGTAAHKTRVVLGSGQRVRLQVDRKLPSPG